jgi:hypothetical protein
LLLLWRKDTSVGERRSGAVGKESVIPPGKAFVRVLRRAPHLAAKRGPDCVKPWRKRSLMGRVGGGAAVMVRWWWKRVRRFLEVRCRGIRDRAGWMGM